MRRIGLTWFYLSAITLFAASGVCGAESSAPKFCYQKGWKLICRNVELSPSIQRKIREQFSPDSSEGIRRLRPQDFSISSFDVNELSSSEQLELAAIRSSFVIFFRQLSLNENRYGTWEAMKATIGFLGAGVDCYSWSNTVHAFIGWLEDQDLLSHFDSPEIAMSQSNVHVATPLRRISDGHIWLVDATQRESDGGPAVFSFEGFKGFVETGPFAPWAPGAK